MAVKNLILCLGAFLAAGPAFADSEAQYVVQEGDTFSEIVQQKVGSPILGKNGAINRVLRLNPTIKNIHKIFPAQEIKLPAPNVAEAIAEGPSRMPAALPAAEATDGVRHLLNVRAAYDFTSLSSNDKQSGSRATLNSKYSLRLAAAWEQAWADSFSSFAELEVRKIDFEPSTNATKTLAGTKKFLASLHAGAVKKFGGRFSVAASAGLGSELFPRARSASVVEIDAVALPRVSLGLAYRFFEKGQTSLSALAGASYLFGASPDGYTVSGGTRINAGLRLQHEGQANITSLELGFAQRKQETSLVNLTDRDFYGQVLLSIPLFTGDKP